MKVLSHLWRVTYTLRGFSPSAPPSPSRSAYILTENDNVSSLDAVIESEERTAGYMGLLVSKEKVEYLGRPLNICVAPTD